jgi:hypothetical protein
MTEEGHSMNDENIDTHFFTPLVYLEYAGMTNILREYEILSANKLSHSKPINFLARERHKWEKYENDCANDEASGRSLVLSQISFLLKTLCDMRLLHKLAVCKCQLFCDTKHDATSHFLASLQTFFLFDYLQ